MSNLEQKIISLLADNPEREFYGEEISRELKCSKASASILLKKLEKAGFVLKTVRGHMKFYRVNELSPAVKSFRISRAIAELEPLLPKLAKYSKKVILFGSASRGEQTGESDIDLLIIGDKSAVRGVLQKASIYLPIKAIVKTPGEWSETEVSEPEFYREVNKGIILYEYVPLPQAFAKSRGLFKSGRRSDSLTAY